MRLPAIEIPETTDDMARQWAYRLGTLPFEASVDDVAMLISAACAEAVAASRSRPKLIMQQSEGE